MKEKIIKIMKLTFLLTLRQLWTTICNLYLLAEEPFLTIRRIKVKRDKSQVILLGMMFVSPALIYVMVRIITDWWWYRRILMAVGPVFGLIFVVQTSVLAYVLYWVYQVISKNHFRDFREKI